MAKAPTSEQIAEAIRHLRSIGSFTRASAYTICNEAADLIEALALAALHVEARGEYGLRRTKPTPPHPNTSEARHE